MSIAYVYLAYAADGDLLYVGHTVNVSNRMALHKSDDHWYRFYDRLVIEGFGSIEEARDAERTRIADLEPIYNVQGNPRYWPTWAECDERPTAEWRQIAHDLIDADRLARQDAAA